MLPVSGVTVLVTPHPVLDVVVRVIDFQEGTARTLGVLPVVCAIANKEANILEICFLAQVKSFHQSYVSYTSRIVWRKYDWSSLMPRTY